MSHPGLLSLGVGGSLLVATGGMNAVIKAMNRAYGVEESRSFWKRYLLALGLTLLAGTAIIGAFVLFVGGWVFGAELATALGLQRSFRLLVDVVYWPTIGLLLMLAVSVLYWAAPNIDLRFKLVTPGALIFTVGWLAATAAFAAYYYSRI